MTQPSWAAVDDYINGLFVPPDDVLEAALKSSAEAGLPNIQVTPYQGKLLSILARSIGARAILEIGTLGGYSTIWLARALPPDGRLITLEIDPNHAEIARANLARAGLSDQVEIRVGRAVDLLPQLAADVPGAFDLVFMDADRQSLKDYFEWALKLTHKGSLILTDNVVRSGAVVDASSADSGVQGVRRFNQRVASEKRVMTTEIQTVSGKGYDGMAIMLVIGE